MMSNSHPLPSRPYHRKPVSHEPPYSAVADYNPPAATGYYHPSQIDPETALPIGTAIGSPSNLAQQFQEQPQSMSTVLLRKAPPSQAAAPVMAPAVSSPHVLSKKKGITPPGVPAVNATHPAPASERPARLRTRSFSADRLPPGAAKQSNRLQARHASPPTEPRGRSVSAQPPLPRTAAVDQMRIASNPTDNRLHARHASESIPASATDKRKVRKSWFPSGSSKSGSIDMGVAQGSRAWIMSPGDSQTDYNMGPLLNGERVPELWNDLGSVFIYLYPREMNRGPSFKITDYVLSSSAPLMEMLDSNLAAAIAQGSYLQVAEAPKPEAHVYLPLPSSDPETLVATRNLFALLTNQALVATPANPNLFSALLQVSSLLRVLGFSSYDGSSYGEVVDTAFDKLLEQFPIADVRQSNEKTIEALYLAEQMKSWTLYNEAFVHAVGKYESLIALNSSLMNRISMNTHNRLGRAHLDLVNRQTSIKAQLETFDFPSLFAGIANSTSMEEYRTVRFKEWRVCFGKMRSFVLGYYKDLFGNWPPKARSKRNTFSRDGLNRICLKILYSDLCALYDLLVDRKSITPRAIDKVFEDGDDEKKDGTDPSICALRKMLSEFEHSSPPVLPPIPFDIPKIPSLTAIYENYHELSAKKQAKFNQGLQSNELMLVLIKSRNIDIDALQIPFLQAFKDFELKEAKAANPADLADLRIGCWLFLYAVLQSLPMLVVDAPGIVWTKDVEYFLCEAPQGNPPWMEDAGEVRKQWYQTADQNIVELSADVVLFSVEGIYLRSHCWLVAKELEAQLAAGSPGVGPLGGLTPQDTGASPLQPPRAVFEDMDPYRRPASSSGHLSPRPESPHVRSRSGSPSARRRAGSAYRSSIAIGLEPLAMTEDGIPIPPPLTGGSDRGSRGGSPTLTPIGNGYPSLRGSQSVSNLSITASDSASNRRKSSFGGASITPSSGPGHRHAQSQSKVATGGSTFDDILKGMDGVKKTKKNWFF